MTTLREPTAALEIERTGEVADHNPPIHPHGSTGRGGIALALGASFLVNLVLAFSSGIHSFEYGDSSTYWGSAVGFVASGHFLFSGLNLSYFGFTYPLFNLLIRELLAALPISVDPFTAFRIFDAGLFSTTTVLLVPRVARLAWPSLRINGLQRFALSLIAVFFWRGFLDVNLTDIPGLAVLLLLIAVASGRVTLLRSLLVGLLGGILLNLRPLDFLAVIPALIIVGRKFVNVQRAKRRLTFRVSQTGQRLVGLHASAILAGLIVISAPQSFLNHNHYGLWSPVAGAPGKVDLQELNFGITNDRFDSAINSSGASVVVWYPDPSTGALVSSLPGQTLHGYGDYLGLAIRHPLQMLGSYWRKLILGLDVHYAQIYTPGIQLTPNILDFASCLCVFLALLRLGVLWKRGRLRQTNWLVLAALLLPCLASLTSDIEPRFLLPLDVLVYALIVTSGWSDLIAAQRPRVVSQLVRRGILVLGAFGLWITVWFSVVGPALATSHT